MFLSNELNDRYIKVDTLEQSGILVKKQCGNNEAESHEYYEIIYLSSGRASCVIQYNTLELCEHDICIIPPKARHVFCTYDGGISVSIQCSDSDIIEFMNIFKPSGSIRDFFTKYSDGLFKYCGMLWKISEKTYIRSVIEELLIEKDMGPKVRQGLLLSLLVSLCSLRPNMAKSVYAESVKVCDILRYIIDSYTDATLETIASRFNYSPTYVSILLKKATGYPFMSILQKRRMSLALEYMLCTKKSIQEISRSVGCRNVKYFVKQFTQIYSYPPSEYRRRYL